MGTGHPHTHGHAHAHGRSVSVFRRVRLGVMVNLSGSLGKNNQENGFGVPGIFVVMKQKVGKRTVC